jgi:transcriptional regulator of arginine metabolism
VINVKSKSERLEAIRKLVQEKRIGTQEDLVKELEKQGFGATQATVSRDIMELRLQKIRTAEGSIYTLPQMGPIEEIDHLQRMLKDFVNGIIRTGNLIVLRTSPGTAQGVASAVDNVRWGEVLGTIAGDDTILLVTVSSKTSVSVLKRLEELKRS